MDKKKQSKKTAKTVDLKNIPADDIIAAYNALFEFNPPQQRQDDEYSLAQPHALRFVPNLLSNNTATNKR